MYRGCGRVHREAKQMKDLSLNPNYTLRPKLTPQSLNPNAEYVQESVLAVIVQGSGVWCV